MQETRVDTSIEVFAGTRVATLTLHGAKGLNVVDGALLDALATAVAAVQDTPGLRCICLCGAGRRAFVGGADLRVLRALDPHSAEGFIRAVHRACAALRAAPVPVIAVMRGYCLGAGLEIAAACDIRVGDHSVLCGMPEVRVGVPSVVEAALLPGLIGWGKARELMLRGHLIEAEEARACGLLQHVVAPAELDELVRRIACDIGAGAAGAIAAQKRLFLAWEEAGSVAQAVERGVEAFVDAYRDDAPRQAIDAFYAGRR